MKIIFRIYFNWCLRSSTNNVLLGLVILDFYYFLNPTNNTKYKSVNENVFRIVLKKKETLEAINVSFKQFTKVLKNLQIV